MVNSEDEGALPGERLTGEAVVILYNALHPEHGDVDDKALWHNRIKKFYGHKIKLTANGERREEDGENIGRKLSRVYIQRVGMVNEYADVFGNDGLYYRIMKAIFEADSEGEIIVTSLTFELATAADVDSEGIGDGA